MKKHFALTVPLALALIAVAAVPPADAGFLITGGTQLVMPSNNDFKTDLAGFGLTALINGGQVSVDMAGEVLFYYHAAESGYTDSFVRVGSIIKTENNEAWSYPGEYIGSLGVAAGDILDIGFSTTATSGSDAPNGNSGFAIFVPGLFDDNNDRKVKGLFLSDTGVTEERLFFGYGDHGGGGDADYDDMIVSAVFHPSEIPEPATIGLIGLGLAGGLGLRRRRRRR